jgi:peptide/nickel transport system substrate-binding protein
MKRDIRTTIIATAWLAAVSHCAYAQNAPVELKFTAPDPKDVCSNSTPGVGGTFYLRAYSQGSGFDPANVTYSLEAGRAIYGSLMRYDAERKRFEPYYAESLASNESGDEWALKLPVKARYSDGTQLTAQAVKQSIERFLNPDSPNIYAPMLRLIKSMDVRDDQTLVFKLQSPWGSFPWVLAQPPGQIINPKVLAKLSAKELAAEPPPEAGLGAFKFGSWTPGRNMTLKKQPDWWNGKVCIDEVDVTWSASGQSNYEGMLAGQVDYFRTWDAPALLLANQNKDVRLYPAPWVASTYDFNHKSPAVSDVRVRQAIQYQVNGAVVNQRIWQGIGSDSHALAPPRSPIAPETKPLVYNVEEAKKLIDEAAKDGWPKKIRYTINATPGNVNQGVLQQAMAKAVGIDLTRDELQIGEYYQKVRVQRNFEATMGAIFADEACPWCTLSLYESNNPGNFTGSAFPELDAALAEVRSAGDVASLKQSLSKLQPVWNAKIPAAIAGWLANSHIFSNRVRGVLTGSANTEVYVDKAYIVK